jgi:hypothetical protein
MSATSTICRLCLKEAKLSKSHIISEFLYTPMYDEKTNRFFVISSDPERPDRTRPTGIYERLLCADCEQVLNRYEDYGAKALKGGTKVEYAQVGNELRMRGVDYAKLKLFYLSLLWRMSVSTQPFFKEVALGPHEEVLRKMLLDGRPGDVDEYGVLCVAPLFEAQHLGDWIMPPDKVRTYGRTVYRCLIGGLLYSFFVGKATLPKPLVERFIQEDGSWTIIREKIERIRFLADWCIRMGKAMNERRQKGGSKV